MPVSPIQPLPSQSVGQNPPLSDEQTLFFLVSVKLICSTLIQKGIEEYRATVLNAIVRVRCKPQKLKTLHTSVG